jgi:hypothetical protein
LGAPGAADVDDKEKKGRRKAIKGTTTDSSTTIREDCMTRDTGRSNDAVLARASERIVLCVWLADCGGGEDVEGPGFGGVISVSTAAATGFCQGLFAAEGRGDVLSSAFSPSLSLRCT